MPIETFSLFTDVQPIISIQAVADTSRAAALWAVSVYRDGGYNFQLQP